VNTLIMLMALAGEPAGPPQPVEVKECLSLEFGLGIGLGRPRFRDPYFAPRFGYPRPYPYPRDRFIDRRILRLLLLQQYLRDRDRIYYGY
jgi:hypothetical protein